ncbi:RNA polymerase sigma-70 factor [Pedobacter insulae]|uniref:RNA polymerase sigma-70 factor, ECF subfamily n=1 Tax=Pedobacter insulae TaxID=414048 RepID=A0A1I2VL67_9SPHI|nr:RNA polymerase sigma-70 factor [Pedobacter insulae]SFG87951.1 RNA polymerase sigma-70 factor, ECF subfamily [Pedobacter insulae]
MAFFFVFLKEADHKKMAIKPLDNEKLLLAKIAKGDQHAFCTIFDYYRKYVYSFGRKLTHSDELAEEIVQDIFLKIWFGRERLTSLESFGAYLNRLVRNHAFNLIRQEAQARRVNQDIRLSVSDQDFDTENLLDYRETVRVLNQALDKLPEQQKIVYTLCHTDGLKYEEAAERMNVSPATVHYHMKLALAAIREHFAKNSVAYPVLLVWMLK